MSLEVVNLRTSYRTAAGALCAVDGVSFELGNDENLGLVGESGCGKTTLAKSLLRLAGGTATTAGQVRLDGRDVLTLSATDLNRVRWQDISLITQGAMNSLDPVQRVGDQIVETLRVHTDMSRRAARDRARELFTLVRLDARRLAAYPHQLSGGMRQRSVIALALALEPGVVIADEPTTALDVVVQAGILDELRRIKARLRTSMLLITHDIGVVAQTCERVAVMYAGQIIEIGRTRDVLTRPMHPYTMGLQKAFPTPDAVRNTLISIPGTPPSLISPPNGCRFAPRCPFATERCRTELPELADMGRGQLVRCHYADRADALRTEAAEPTTWQILDLPPTARRTPSQPQRADGPMVLATDLRRWYPVRRGALAAIARRPARHVHAVDGVTLHIGQREILGLAGESGSGKSTLGELIVGLQTSTGGTLTFPGVLSSATAAQPEFRRKVQMVFQDPYETLNPRFTVARTISEPLRNLKIGTKEDRQLRIEQALVMAGLTPPQEFLDRLPHQLSGGQRQRIALARAIVVEPQLLVADEPVSMLDVSIRAGILNLLRRFRDDLGTSVLYISHDLATISYLCDRTAIMYAGRIVEVGPTEEVIQHPRHPYTRLLVASIPSPVPRIVDDELAVQRDPDSTEVTDLIDLPNGCRFHNRCPHAMRVCGWEGRDVARLVRRRQAAMEGDETASAKGHEALGQIVRLSVTGTDLEVHLRDPSAGPRVAAYLRLLMEQSASPSIATALTDVKTLDDTVVLRFDALPEPPAYDAGETAVACHLFATLEQPAPLPVATTGR